MLEAAINPDAQQKMGEFIRQFKPTFPLGMVDPNAVGAYSQFTPAMRPTVPIMFFIDRKFVIRAQYLGSDPIFNQGDQKSNIRAEIEKLLNEKPAAPAKKPAAKTATKGK